VASGTETDEWMTGGGSHPQSPALYYDAKRTDPVAVAQYNN